MSPASVTVGVRLEAALLARLDAYAAHLESLAGLPVTRATAARKLLAEALDRAEGKRGKARKR